MCCWERQKIFPDGKSMCDKALSDRDPLVTHFIHEYTKGFARSTKQTWFHCTRSYFCVVGLSDLLPSYLPTY